MASHSKKNGLEGITSDEAYQTHNSNVQPQQQPPQGTTNSVVRSWGLWAAGVVVTAFICEGVKSGVGALKNRMFGKADAVIDGEASGRRDAKKDDKAGNMATTRRTS